MRHELKYIVSDKQMVELDALLKTVMQVDEHQDKEGYLIRSLYFDTEEDRFLNESLNGIDERSKFRIRTYNNSSELIRFEKKITVNNLKDKYSDRINKSEVIRLLEGESLSNIDGDVLKEVFLLEKNEMLKPKAIIEYDRFAYVYPVGNVRITFDRNIRTSGDIKEFLSNPLFLPVLPYGRHILEVKYDGILPGYIARLLKLGSLERVSFSKYALGRNVIENNGRLLETYEY